MTNPALLVSSNTYTVTNKHKYQKARHHCLVLPNKLWPNLESMTKEDMDLLTMMNREAA